MKLCPIVRFASLIVPLSWPLEAIAYRPFVSTDAAVVEKGSAEIELGIVDYSNHHGRITLDSPDLRFNFGFAKGWEISMEGAMQVFDSADGHRFRIIDPELSIKAMLVNGPLQERGGPLGLAFEMSAVLPASSGDRGVGVEAVMIASWRTGDFTWHLNAGMGWERELREPTAVWGLIVERKLSKTLRVAAEFHGESARRTGPVNTALLGLLWEHGRITYDAGVSFGLSSAAPDVAFSVGLTFKL
jgi:hypothetical protein